MVKTRRRKHARRIKRTRAVKRTRKHRGGNNYLLNVEYPTQTKGYPSMDNFKLPDPVSTPNALALTG